MSESMEYPFTRERIEEQSHGNLHALIFGSIAYAKAQGHDGRHLATFLGERFAPSWTEITSPREAAAASALNGESMGMRTIAIGGDDSRSELVMSDAPEFIEALALFGLSQAEADQFWDVFEPIARSLNFTFAWRREDDQIHFTYAKH